jgi:hypothetical protein
MEVKNAKFINMSDGAVKQFGKAIGEEMMSIYLLIAIPEDSPLTLQMVLDYHVFALNHLYTVDGTHPQMFHYLKWKQDLETSSSNLLRLSETEVSESIKIVVMIMFWLTTVNMINGTNMTVDEFKEKINICNLDYWYHPLDTSMFYMILENGFA